MELFYTTRVAAISFAACAVGSDFYLGNISADLYVGLMGSIVLGRIALGLDLENYEKGISVGRKDRRSRIEETIRRKF